MRQGSCPDGASSDETLKGKFLPLELVALALQLNGEKALFIFKCTFAFSFLIYDVYCKSKDLINNKDNMNIKG